MRPTLDEVRRVLGDLCPAQLRPDEFGDEGPTMAGAHRPPSKQWSIIRVVSRPAGASIRRVGATETIATAPYDLVVSSEAPFVELELALDGHATRRVRINTDEAIRTIDLPFVVSER